MLDEKTAVLGTMNNRTQATRSNQEWLLALADQGSVVLDVCPVYIGSGTMFGPAVQVLTATHPTDAALRVSGPEYGKPIRIGRDCWIGGGAIIQPGVTIGDRCIVGAGAVVTKDVADDLIVVGNPARSLDRK